jgi:signal transduction histidine kinase
MEVKMMKLIPLHIKMALLASFISLAMLMLGLTAFSVRVAEQIQQEQKDIAVLQAEEIAEELSSENEKLDSNSLEDLVDVISSSRPSILTVRVWKFDNDRFIQVASSDDSFSDNEINQQISEALQKNLRFSVVEPLPEGSGKDSMFRVFSPIFRNNKILGAVEIVQQLDTIPSIITKYSSSFIWASLITFFLMNISFYLLFQRLVYKPLENLLRLSSESAVDEGFSKLDEFAILSDKFNSMVNQIRLMNDERKRQNEILQQKVAQATAQLKHKNEQLEEANLRLFALTKKVREMERLVTAGQITAQLAHEVATPLNLISGHAQLLKNALNADQKEIRRIDLIIEQIERIERIVRETLNRARLKADEHKPLDLNQLLKKIFETVEPILQESKIELEFLLSENLPLILGDSDQLQQVFLNLFNNSLDAMPEGGKLMVSTNFENDEVIVVFSDSGQGLPEEIKSKIFQPLFTTKQPGHGTGLGLFIVKEILQDHNAEIEVESQLKKGTTFRLIFKKLYKAN